MPKRTDNNQQEIVKALRKMGAAVLHTHTLGGGAPDLIVSFRGRSHLVEIKRGHKKLNKLQLAFHDSWHSRIYILRSVDEAVQFMNALRAD